MLPTIRIPGVLLVVALTQQIRAPTVIALDAVNGVQEVGSHAIRDEGVYTLSQQQLEMGLRWLWVLTKVF